MPATAKRFYVCNLIPLWNVDEENVSVDWPTYHRFFGDLIELKAEITHRRIRWSAGDGRTPDPDLRVRFEVYESDFLLSGGMNDLMGVISSHADYGDEPEVRAIRLIDVWRDVPAGDREKFIFARWKGAADTTVTVTAPDGTVSTRTERTPDTLEVRTWWRVRNPEGGDVAGDPEFYYDLYLDSKLENGEALDLHERSDHELVGFGWNVTSKVRKGRATPMVDGEYAFLKMLQLIDGAAQSIHILNWKMDPQAGLALEHEFQADYLQVPGLDAIEYERLLLRNKPLVRGVATASGIVAFTLSNGNLVFASADGLRVAPAIQQIDDPTNVDLPTGVLLLPVGIGTIMALVVDQLRSRLLVYVVLPQAMLQPLAEGVSVAVFGSAASPRGFPFFHVRPTLPEIMVDATVTAGVFAIAGNGHAGFAEGGVQVTGALAKVVSQMNRPTAVCAGEGGLFISDTGNHSIRVIRGFGSGSLSAFFASNALQLESLAGARQEGDADGTAAAARFRSPTGMAWDSIARRLLVADTGNKKVRAIVPGTGSVSTIAVRTIDGAAATLGAVTGLAFDAARGTAGTLYTTERDRHRVLAIDLETGAASTLAGSTTGGDGYADGALASTLFRRPVDLALDGDSLYVADSRNHVVRVIDLAGGTARSIGARDRVERHDVPVVLADVLRRKSEVNGVPVRVLIDKLGAGISRDQVTSENSMLGLSGEEVAQDLRFYSPGIAAFVQGHPQEAFGHTAASFHEKMLVVDGKHGVTGGLDFAPDKNDGLLHQRKHRVSLPWHDVVALVEGKAALGLEEHFVRRWMLLREETSEDAPRPDELRAVDRTNAGIVDADIESVHTYNPAPVLRNVFAGSKEDEILQSYRRGILGARHYVYLEHQYIYYPKIGEYLEQAMQDNRDLQVIWTIPFFTEESRDPYQERASMEADRALASAITDTGALGRTPGGLMGQVRRQLYWHGFFRQHEMVEKLRRVDPARFGVFSVQRLFARRADLSDLRAQMIYPHTKMLLADDRFFSIGSANANGRGFSTDGEHNISAIAPDAARSFRQRLWGEHLGYQGLGVVTDDGALLPVAGHHLEPGVTVRLTHHRLGTLERVVDTVDAPSGAVMFREGVLDITLGRILWQDARFADAGPEQAIQLWRQASHPLRTFRLLKGLTARTDGGGALLVPGHLAAPGDGIALGGRLLRLSDDGSAAASEPIYQPAVAAVMEVAAVAGERITLRPADVSVKDDGWVRGVATGSTIERRPFAVRVKSRSGGVARLQLTLIPNQSDVPFDYLTSWLVRQPGAIRGLRAWEIDPPPGIEYGGPFSTLFSPWFVLPWLILDFDPDKMVRLDSLQPPTRIV